MHDAPSCLVSGRSSSRLAWRLPDSRRESVLTDIPARPARSARVHPRAVRASRKAGADEPQLFHDSPPLAITAKTIAMSALSPTRLTEWKTPTGTPSSSAAARRELATALMLGRALRRTLVIDAGSPRNGFRDCTCARRARPRRRAAARTLRAWPRGGGAVRRRGAARTRGTRGPRGRRCRRHARRRWRAAHGAGARCSRRA